jgi:predicted lipid-binding transport protein (Tim44 family)
MSTNQDDMEKVQDKVRELEVAQATQAATLAGAQATQAAAHAGTWSTMLAGAGGLVVGMFLGMAIVRGARRSRS